MDHSQKPLEGQFNLSPKARLRILREDLRLRMKTLLSAEYRRPNDATMRKIFPNKSYDFIRKLFSKGHDVPWRADYAEPIVLWLQQVHGLPAPLDLFSAHVTTAEEFRQLYARKPNRSGSRQPYARLEHNELSLLLNQIDVAKSDPFYFRTTSQWPLGLAAKDTQALKQSIVDHGVLPPAPELERLGDTHSMCTGCGRGARVHRLFAEVFDTIWERRDEILPQLGSEREHLGFASVIALSVQGKCLNGDLEQARERAAVIDVLWGQGRLGPDTPAVMTVRSKIREARVVGLKGEAPDELKFLESTGSAFGIASDEYLSELKCRACRAVAAASPLARDRIEEARQAMRRVATNCVDRRGKVESAMKDLDFIELTYLERGQSYDASELDAFFRISVGVPYLKALLAKTNAPLRKAKLCHWVWRATGRENPILIKAALALAARRAQVRHLCVFDVQAMRQDLHRAHADAEFA